MDRYNRYMPRTCSCGVRRTDRCTAKNTEYCVCSNQPVSLAMAYVPIQEWGELFSPCEALENGTLFRDLVKPYCTGGCRR